MEVVRDVACPTCGRLFNKFSVGRHKPNCPDKPENRALIAQWLPNPERPGYARTETEYRRDTPNKPCSNSLFAHFGKWSVVAESFGLQATNHNLHRIQNKLQATGAELQRLSQELHAGAYGPTRKEYCLHKQRGNAGTCALDAQVLGEKFGNWAAVLANWDLIPPPAEEVRETTRMETYSSSPYWFVGSYVVTFHPHTHTWRDKMDKLTFEKMSVVVDDIKPDSGQFDIESMMKVYFSAKTEADKYTNLMDTAKERIKSVMLANGSAKETTAIGVASMTAGSISVSYDAKALDILTKDDPYLADRIAIYRKESIREGSLRIVQAKE